MNRFRALARFRVLLVVTLRKPECEEIPRPEAGAASATPEEPALVA